MPLGEMEIHSRSLTKANRTGQGRAWAGRGAGVHWATCGLIGRKTQGDPHGKERRVRLEGERMRQQEGGTARAEGLPRRGTSAS